VEDEGDDEEDQLPEQHLQGAQPQPAIPTQTKMLTQIWAGMQDIKESMRNVNIRFDRVDDKMNRVHQRMDTMEDTLNQIHRHQGN